MGLQSTHFVTLYLENDQPVGIMSQITRTRLNDAEGDVLAEWGVSRAKPMLGAPSGSQSKVGGSSAVR